MTSIVSMRLNMMDQMRRNQSREDLIPLKILIACAALDQPLKIKLKKKSYNFNLVLFNSMFEIKNFIIILNFKL